MALSEWARSVRAIGDIPVATYPMPGMNTMYISKILIGVKASRNPPRHSA